MTRAQAIAALDAYHEAVRACSLGLYQRPDAERTTLALRLDEARMRLDEAARAVWT